MNNEPQWITPNMHNVNMIDDDDIIEQMFICVHLFLSCYYDLFAIEPHNNG